MSAAESGGAIPYLYRYRWSIIVAFLIFLVIAAVIFFMQPLLDGIIFGIFFAYVTRPIKDFLSRRTRYAPIIATFCVLLPVIVVILFTGLAAKQQIDWLSQHGSDVIDQLNAILVSLDLPADVMAQVNDVLANLTDYAMAVISAIPVGATFTSILLFATNALVSLFVCFYLLKDGQLITEIAGHLTPARFRPALGAFVTEADRILAGIYTGTFYTALFVAMMSAVIFFVFGIPNMVLLTAFVFIAAMVPILSGMMVFIPLAIYLYVARSPLIAIVFFLSALILVYVPPDFILRPYLINRASNIHPLLIILSFVGGGLAGGISGFFAAPLAVGLLVALYRTYLKFGKKDDESPAAGSAGP
ncbi:MAG: putative inner membrane protein [Methanocella sp. PtaU1.Bin125]|nr:MAG: putative inner membrane protein [Methanocella sp. PtaU1.Bin125]